MSKRKPPSSKAAALALATLEGPPMHLRAPVARGAGDARGAPELRPALVEEATWRDPTDTTTAMARARGAKPINGWRRVWTIAALHRSAPREITAAHVKAAERLLGDYELGVEMVSGGKGYDRVDCVGPGSISDDRIDALARYQSALAAVGNSGASVLRWVVIDNRTVSWLGDKLGIHRHRAHGRLYAAIERLREHYWPPRRDAAPQPVYEPVLADAGLMAEDREGRWRVAGGAAAG